jgi:haloacetate dehalogenase
MGALRVNATDVTDRAFAEAYYHWFFLIQPFDLRERLIGSEADYFLQQI